MVRTKALSVFGISSKEMTRLVESGAVRADWRRLTEDREVMVVRFGELTPS